MTTQIRDGMPVAAAILAASVCCVPAAEIKNRSLRLKKAFSRHCTARKARAKFTHFAGANLAIAAIPAASTAPENTVKTTLRNVTLASRFQNGARRPKAIVITPTSPAEMYNAIRDDQPKRIQASNIVPNAVVPR